MKFTDLLKSYFLKPEQPVKNEIWQVAKADKQLPSELIIPKALVNRQYSLMDWHKAVMSATNPDNPNRKLLYDLYDNLMIDLHTSALLNSRVEPVWRAKFRIEAQKSKEKNPELLPIFDMNWFEDFIEYAIESVFYGYSLLELNDFYDLTKAKIELIPRQHVDPINEIIKIDPFDTKGYSYTENLATYYIGIGSKKDLGLLYKIAPVLLAKKYAMGMWSEYNEKMVIPFRTVKTPSRDKKRHQLLGQILQEMGSAGWAVLNDEEIIELTEISGKDAYKAYETFIDRMENSITRLVLGQTATTNQDNTGTYGSLKILMEVAENRHASDKNFVKRLVNNELIPRLILFGQKLTGYIFNWDDATELTTEQKIDLYNKLNLNYTVPPEYVSEQIGIPVTAKQFQPQITANGNQKKKSKLSIFGQIRAFYGYSNPEGFQNPQGLDFDNDAELDRILKLVHEGKLTKGMIDIESYQRIANGLFTQVTTGFNDNLKNIKYNNTDANLIQFFRGNIFKFSAAKNEKQFRELSAKLLNADGTIKPFNKFKTDVLTTYNNYNKNWLQTEYRTALAQSQNAAIFADAWKTKDLYDLQYVTAKDEKVRDDHAKLDGIVRPVDDGFWKVHTPPNDWNCRCKLRKVAKGTTITKDEDLRNKKPAKQFQYSAYHDKKIFSSQHPYLNRFDENKLLATENYGMKTIEDIYYKPDKLAKREKDFTEEEFKEFWKKLAEEQKLKETNSFIIETKLNDKLLFDNDLYNKILDKKATEKRWEIASNLKDIVTKPDEVWTGYNTTTKHAGNIITYIKYYNDKAIVVICNLTDDNIITVNSFYEIKEKTNKGHLGDLRKGVLLFRK